EGGVRGVAVLEAERAEIRAGPGQDFGRTHGLPVRFDDAVRAVVEGRTATIDLGRATHHGGERYFANVGTVGMSGAVARRANSMSKALGGRATFYYALTREFLGWRNCDVTVSFGGGERGGPLH